MKKIMNSKGFKIARISIKVVIGIILIGFILAVCLQRFSDNEISIFNYRMFTVITGSMRPKYDVGDVLISKEVEPSTIEIGDTITYLGEVNDFAGKVVTHEVVGIETDENEEFVFRTKGLANYVEDPEVHEDQVYGVIIYRSIILSTIYKIIGTPFGFYIFIILPIMFIIISEIISTMLSKEDKKRGIVRE